MYGLNFRNSLEENMTSNNNYTIEDLKKWDDKICAIAEKFGLDWYPINYEICDYYEMIGHMAYHGMPSHYNHWSYGKSFERTHFFYNSGQQGLPYELIINSDPSIAYLMLQNEFYLQVLIMAHCVGHSDFFKNNRCFQQTDARNVVSKMRNAKKRIQGYIENPLIGQDRVENFLDNLHTIKFQTQRYNIPRKTKSEILQEEIQRYNRLKDEGIELDYSKLEGSLLKPDHDILSFLLEYKNNWKTWQMDLIEIVRDESWYFMPQIKTKILNEGWASFWHYKILHELNLVEDYHVPFMKMHNAVVRPHIGGVNPYHLGFYIFQKLEREHGLEKCFEVRETHDDVAAIRLFLDEEDFRKLNFFSHQKQKNGDVLISEVADHDDWKVVRSDLIKNTGINTIPQIYVDRIEKQGNLVLKHEHDGRDLEIQYAEKVVDHIKSLWGNDVKLYTILEDEIWEV
jgi:stage V sporulation protein R